MEVKRRNGDRFKHFVRGTLDHFVKSNTILFHICNTIFYFTQMYRLPYCPIANINKLIFLL